MSSRFSSGTAFIVEFQSAKAFSAGESDA